MVKVKINGKTYEVKEMKFAEFTRMEEQGISIVEAFRKKQMMLIAMGFTCVAANCDREEAEELVTQHVFGGGNIIDITNAFSEALDESPFFQKMFGMTPDEKKAENDPEEKPKKSPKTKDEEVEE